MRPRSEIVRASGFAGFLILLMLVEWLRRIEFASPAIRSLQADLMDIVLSKSTQVPIVIALFAYFAGLLWIAVWRRGAGDAPAAFWKRFAVLDGCKVGLALFALAACLPAWKDATTAGSARSLQLGIDQTTNALVLLTGLVVGGAVEVLINTGANSGRVFRRVPLAAIALFLAATSLFQPAAPFTYKYRDAVRGTGLWVNPNTYGLLMGIGLMLAACLGTRERKTEDGRRRKAFRVCLWLFVAGLCGFGLLKSYSRGAWVATGCGLAFLGWQLAPARLRRHWMALALALASLFTLAFWQFRFTQAPLAARTFSVGNVNDFSWRNRVTVWRGSLRMLRDRPLLGFGWGRVEPAYANSYRAPRLEETMAIQLNDFFTLGLSAGLPALLCFLGCAGLSLASARRRVGLPELQPRETSNRETELAAGASEPLWQAAAVHGGCVLLLVGFWFDGGLFRLATGPLFWVLAELSRSSAHRRAGLLPTTSRASSRGLGKTELALRWAAGLLVLLAATETSLHLVLPRLNVSRRTLALARKYLLQADETGDFSYLSTNAVWRGRPVGTLIEHVRLARYNRELVPWRLNEQTFRAFVLSPYINPDSDGEMNWRRPLWEYFYPRVRREQDPIEAARTVVEDLQNRVTVARDSIDDKPILAIWQRRRAGPAGFQALCVAALRSVGIAARPAPSGQVEVLDAGQWTLLPVLRTYRSGPTEGVENG